MLIYQE